MNTVLHHSLRARLLWFLLGAIVVTAALQAVVAYRTALTETDEIFDYQMQQIAASLRSGLPLASAELEQDAPSDEDSIEFIIQVWTAEGLRVFQSASRAELPQRAVLGFSNVNARGTSYRVFSVATGNQIVQIAQDLTARQKMAGTLALRTVAPVALMVPLLLLAVWWVVSTSLSPVARVRQQLATRHADELDEVSEEGLPDEVAPLVRELNLLFKRVGQAFDAQKHFVADAAHELRSPLAALKLQVQGLRRAIDAPTREIAIQRLTGGIDRATRLVEQLLILARQQTRVVGETKMEAVPMEKLVQRVLADMWDTAQVHQIDIGLITSNECVVNGQEEALQILVRNLIDNAIKYSPRGGAVNVSLHRRNTHVTLTIEDSGSGIPESDRERVFDRFFRLVGAQTSGSGLGLAIVKTIADSHAAVLSLDSSKSLGGLAITVAFPTNA